jgi:hypothetical protein
MFAKPYDRRNSMKSRKLSALMPILGVVLMAAVVGRPIKALHAEEGGITLASLAGSFAASATGIETVCVGGCAAPTKLVPLNDLNVGQETLDDLGNFCGFFTFVAAPVAGTKNPASTGRLTIAGKVSAFDPVTESGDDTFSVYVGGSCTGAVFNSGGATLNATGTRKFVVSQNGNHIAFALTSLTNVTGTIGGVFFFGTFDRQEARHQ